MFGETRVHLLSPGSPGWNAGVGPSQHLSFPAASPQPAVRVLVTSARCTTCPPSPPQRPESPHTHPSMPPRADVAVPGSCLRGERQARLMCDETESSEPLGGSGSKGVRGVEEGYQERLEWGSRRWGRVQGGRDAGIRLITISVSTEHRVWDVPALEVRKLRRMMMVRRRKEETRRNRGRKNE